MQTAALDAINQQRAEKRPPASRPAWLAQLSSAQPATSELNILSGRQTVWLSASFSHETKPPVGLIDSASTHLFTVHLPALLLENEKGATQLEAENEWPERVLKTMNK